LSPRRRFYLFDGSAAAFLCRPLSDCPATIESTLDRIVVPLQWLLAAAATFALLWLAYSSARVALAFAGIVAVAWVGAMVLHRIGGGGGFRIHWGVWVVVSACLILQLVNSFRKHERVASGARARLPSCGRRPPTIGLGSRNSSPS
jgi:hypothetical protein